MRYLGLDISSKSTGWAILEDDALVDYGVIKTEGEGVTKLIDFYSQMNNILDQYDNIDWIGIEDVYIENAKTVKVLSRYAGVALLITGLRYKIYDIFYGKDIDALVARKNNPRARPKIPTKGIYMPMPSEVFTYLGIPYPKDRNNKKQEAMDFVKDNFYLDVQGKDDIADAICIAFATKQAANKLLS